jgi:PAS domain-containing protein
MLGTSPRAKRAGWRGCRRELRIDRDATRTDPKQARSRHPGWRSACSRSHLIQSGVVAHQLTDEQRRRGGLTRQAQLRTEREERRRRLEAVLDAKLEALADALIAKALEGDVAALREAIHQLVGRPTEVVSGHPERPVRVVVESISSRRREALADVEADAAEVEELPPGAT